MKKLFLFILVLMVYSSGMAQAFADRTASVVNADTGRAASNKITAGSLKWVIDSLSAVIALKANATSPAFSGTPTGLLSSHVGLGNVNNTSDANKPVSTATQTALDLKANAASPTVTGTAALPIVTMTGKITNYNGINTVSNGVASILATIDLTAQAANIGTTTLYAVPSAGFYRLSIYITVTQAATTSSTMPSTTIAYTDGNAGTNAHSTTTTATNASNSVTTSFAQTTYVLYAKASTNITYATGSYASSGGTPMQYALRIRLESL